MCGPIGQFDLGEAFSFAPTPAPVELSETGEFANAGPDGESLNMRDFPEDLEVHVTRPRSLWLPSNDRAQRTATMPTAPRRARNLWRARGGHDDSRSAAARC